MTCIFDVCNFNFGKSKRKKNCFLGCHTNTLGSNLRSFPQMEKRADGADASVLFFSLGCANFLAVHVQTS